VLGVVHRDVSPQNVLLSYEGAVKISDFGLAKVRAASGVVRSDVVRGKPSYMSPEQIAGDPLDGRTDLYAAGVMLWEMLADRPLFTGTLREITAQQLFREVARPSSFHTGVPLDVEAVAMTMLARDRAQRYPSAQAAIDALLGCVDVARDGRGDLADLLVERFPEAGARFPGRLPSARASRAGSAGEPRSARPGPITVAAPPSGTAEIPDGAAPQLAAAEPGEMGEGDPLDALPVICDARPGQPRRRLFAAMLGLVVLGGLAAAVLARGDIASPRPFVPAVPVAPVAPAAPVAPRAPVGPRTAAVPVVPAPPVLPAAATAPAALPRAPRHERLERGDRPVAAVRTGELAIIVRPWAMIWLNGKPSGQTPFRSTVPAGRYRVRLANDDAGRDEVTTVTVEPDRTATVERSW
jgi:serine/threonine-protein kinase